jgi:hypothetical protein
MNTPSTSEIKQLIKAADYERASQLCAELLRADPASFEGNM